MKKFFLALLVSLGLCSVAMANSHEPVSVIQNSANQILTLLKKDNGSNSAKIRAEVETIATPIFDFQRMTALAVGRNWRSASAEQQTELTQSFQLLLTRTYAATMSRYKSAQIEINPNPILSSNGREAIVRSTIVLPGADRKTVSADYTLYKSNVGWKIFNVNVEGASLVTVYRTQFNEEIRKGGVDGLISALKAKTARSGSR